MQKEPIAYILNNLDTIYHAYLAGNRGPKATYETLKSTLSDIDNEVGFPTFNSRIKPIIDTYEFLKSDKPIETEKINPEVENLQSALNTVREANQGILKELDIVKQENTALHNENDGLKAKLSCLKSDLQIQGFDLEKINHENVNLAQEVKRLNSIIVKLHEDLQDKEVNLNESNQVNLFLDKPENEGNLNQIEVNQDKPVETQKDNKIMINEILQRIENLEKAVFVQSNEQWVNLNHSGVNQEVNVNQDKPCQKVNLFDKPINKQDKPDKNKVGKWNLTRRGNTYRAYRNFGDKGDIKGVKAVYIGKDLNKAEDKITAKGFPID